MSTLREAREFLEEFFPGSPPPSCFACGAEGTAGAWWRTAENLFVCSNCAVHILGCMLGDVFADVSRGRSSSFRLGVLNDGIKEVEGEIWRAFALAMLRESDEEIDAGFNPYGGSRIPRRRKKQPVPRRIR